ncbi:MAG: alpha/beta hydrolase [Bacteroidota bacterium]
MRPLLLLLICLFVACNSTSTQESSKAEPIDKQFFLELGGEEQYIEIRSSSSDNPILLFLHGGPAWPQTPQFRYFNAELEEAYTLVVWEQRGAGKNFAKNPKPDNLSLDQIVKDGLELTHWLQQEYGQKKIYLAGYSWGSLVGVKMVQQEPAHYKAYFGVAQFINMTEGMKISQNWLKEMAIENDDKLALAKLDSLAKPDMYADEHDRFFQQYLLVNDYKGALHNTDAIPEMEKAQTGYEDYKDYDWYGVWEASSKVLQKDFYVQDVREIKALAVPVILFQGRHDWNVPSVLAEAWLDQLQAPKKEIIWFENSGHGPLEEEPKAFNEAMMAVRQKLE